MLGRPSLRDRGWTDTLINRFLPEQDLLAPNPHYRSGATRKLYLKSRVEGVEAGQDFQVAKAQTATRKAAAAKAVATKEREIEGYVNSLTIEVPQMADNELIARACRHYNSRQRDLALERGGRYWDYREATPESDQSFLNRISVNFLRHELTRYEACLDQVFGKCGAVKAYPQIKAKVLDAIATAYPSLATECERQRGATSR